MCYLIIKFLSLKQFIRSKILVIKTIIEFKDLRSKYCENNELFKLKKNLFSLLNSRDVYKYGGHCTGCVCNPSTRC